MTGDNNGRWNSAKDPKANDWPLDHSLYLSCAADVMRMLRNHPSLLFWCGGNELLPPKNAAGWQLNLIDHKLRDMVAHVDGHRFYVSDPSPLLSGIPRGFRSSVRSNRYRARWARTIRGTTTTPSPSRRPTARTMF